MRTSISALVPSKPCSSKYAVAFYATPYRTAILGQGSSRGSGRNFHSSSRWLDPKAAQPQTSATENVELTPPAAYISDSNDPWFNLSYEDWLLRNTPHNQPVLFLYRNRPCVVFGRNQESTPHQLEEWDIPLIRRRSGGGTVFHDMGNTNFSIILPRLLFTRAHGAELVSRAIRERLGIKECTVNDRNDVIIRDGSHDFKVSGSAYKIIQHRAYHHGTMLINSSLADLGKSLKPSSPNIRGKSVASVRSPVTTLNTYLPSSRIGTPLTHDDFAQAVLREFAAVYGQSHTGTMPITPVSEAETTREGTNHDKIWKGVQELKSWEWTYGQTPEFENTIEGELSFGKLSASLTSRHALIQSMSLQLLSLRSSSEHQESLDIIASALIGKRYATLEGVEDEAELSSTQEEVLAWLRAKM